MNNTTNLDNTTATTLTTVLELTTSKAAIYKSHEFYLEFAGSLVITDFMSLFIMPVVIGIGIIINLAGFFIIQKNPQFKLNLYYFLKTMFLNSAISNGFGIFFAVVNARRYLPFCNTWFAVAYSLQIVTPVVYMCFFINNILDLYMAYDKLSIFITKLSLWNKKYFNNPSRICFFTCIVCIAISFPLFFMFEPTIQLVQLSENETYLFYDYTISKFGLSALGIAYTYVDFFLMAVLPFCLLLGINIPLIILLKRYFNKRERIICNTRKLYSITRTKTFSTVVTNNSTTTSKKDLANMKDGKRKDLNAGIMVVAICSVSFIKNLLVLIAIIYTYEEIGLVSVLLYNYAYYFIFFSSSVYFVIVYTFDKKFKTAINYVLTYYPKIIIRCGRKE